MANSIHREAVFTLSPDLAKYLAIGKPSVALRIACTVHHMLQCVASGDNASLRPAVEQPSVPQVLVLLAQIQLHMLSQQTAATFELLSACTTLFREQAQQAEPQAQPQAQLLWSQLQLHFCILRVLVMLTEGRYVELIATGTCHTNIHCLERRLAIG